MAAPFTILIITHHRVVRADVMEGSVTSFKTGPRHADPTGDAALEAVRLDSAKPKRAFVLIDDAFAQTIGLNVSQAAGLNATELERALSFEVEPLSGIAPFDSALGFRALEAQNGQQRYSIAQITLQQRDALQKALAANGVKLSGICHPRNLSETPPPEGDEALRQWLSDAAKLLNSTPPACALVIPADLPTPSYKYVLVGATAFLVAAALCFTHFNANENERASLQAQLAEREKPAQMLAEVKKRFDENKKEFEKLKTENDQRSAAGTLLSGDLVRQRAALGVLLEQLAQSQPEDTVIDAIDTQNNAVTIRGISLEARQADEWVARLSTALKVAGWTVQPMEKVALRRFENGGPYSFTLQANRINLVVPGAAPKPVQPNFESWLQGTLDPLAEARR
jgi:Tfp pilus assembly protein PilN